MSNILHSQGRDDVLAHVSGNLKRLRQEAGLTQIALAKLSGVSRRMIIALETGDANISLSSLDKLAAVLKVDFVELVRDPSCSSRTDINEVTWRGSLPNSEATLLCSAPASREAQMWVWTLDAGDRYDAEPDPDGWHEMVFVTDGMLTITLSGKAAQFAAGGFVTYKTSQKYSYENRGKKPVSFIRNVIS